MNQPHEPLSPQTIQAFLKQWQKSAVLNPTVLDCLHEMNHAFLELLALAREPRSSAEKRSQSRDLILTDLAKLDPKRRAAAARCPFSLFNARFQNGAFWSTLASANIVREPAEAFAVSYKDTAGREGSAALASFAEMALFYSWHLVRSNPLAAQLMLGMSEQTLAVFKRLSLVRLRRLASEQSELVSLRWPDRTKFWQLLLNSSQQGMEGRAEEMRLLGIQMLAAEMSLNVHPFYPGSSARRPSKP